MIETKERIQLPMMALRGLTVFPNMAISFPVGRQKSLDALEVADEGDKRIFLVAQRDPEDASPEQMGLYEFGTVATIKQILKLPGNMTHVIVDDSCPYCRHKKILSGFNSFEDTDPDLAKEWSSDNPDLPSEYMKFI